MHRSHQRAFFLLTSLTIAAAAALVAWAEPAAQPPASSAAGSTTLTGEAIYLRAVHAMRALPVPDYVIFHEEVSARNLRMKCDADGMDVSLHHGDAQAQYRVWFRTRDGEAVTVEVPSGQRCDEAMLEPVGAHGSEDMFGARSTPRPDSDLSVTSGGPPIIAAVRSESAQHYRITLVDQETFEEHAVYRLALQPYRRSMDFPLTGMLVDSNTWLVRQVTGEVSGHFIVASGWVGATITFAEAGAWWVVRDEHFDLAATALLVHTRVRLDVHASDFSFPNDISSVFPSPRPKHSVETR